MIYKTNLSSGLKEDKAVHRRYIHKKGEMLVDIFYCKNISSCEKDMRGFSYGGR